MRAWGLFLSVIVACSGCASAPSPEINRYGGPPLADPANFDRAGVDVIRDYFAEDRQPDGNTVVFASADGLIVFDTGRHPFHTQKIIDLARAKAQPVAAIINSHWHLDHISGNILLRKQWPGAAVYSNDAALTDALGSFLKRGLDSNRKVLADPGAPAGVKEDARLGVDTIEHGDQLHPTVTIEASRTLTIGGRTLELHAAAGASAGDIWIFDLATKLVASGDIITLPAPFLDTACPSAWRAALDEILATPFVRVIPGHGREMTRADVELYRTAFLALLDCANGASTPDACAQTWTGAVSPLLDGKSGDAGQAAAYASYYVAEILRPRAFRADCKA